jgi:dGTPase
VRDIIITSDEQPEISQSKECERAMLDLRTFMFDNVYYNPAVKKEEDLEHIEHIIYGLYDHYLSHPELLPAEYQKMTYVWGIEEMVKDQIAGMTDNYAMEAFTKTSQKLIKEHPSI